MFRQRRINLLQDADQLKNQGGKHYADNRGVGGLEMEVGPIHLLVCGLLTVVLLATTIVTFSTNKNGTKIFTNTAFSTISYPVNDLGIKKIPEEADFALAINLTNTAFSNISYPVNDLGIKKIPEEADFALANLIIECDLHFEYDRHVAFEGGQYDLRQYMKTKNFHGKKEIDIVSDQSSWNEVGHRIYCAELARSYSFSYISKKAKRLYTRTIFDTLDLEVGAPFSEETYHDLIAKLNAYFFRQEQQRLMFKSSEAWRSQRLGILNDLTYWASNGDARLLETMLDQNWRKVMEFAILPRGETKTNGLDLTISDTVWSTVISVLFNNMDRYKPKYRFPKDFDFWIFDPNGNGIGRRNWEVLQKRLDALRLHFTKLLNGWKATGSFATSTEPDILDLTALYMFEIWSQNKDDEFVNRLFVLEYINDSVEE